MACQFLPFGEPWSSIIAVAVLLNSLLLLKVYLDAQATGGGLVLGPSPVLSLPVIGEDDGGDD